MMASARTVKALTATHSRKKTAKHSGEPTEITIHPRQFLTGILLVCIIVVVGLLFGDWIINYAGAINSGPIRRLFNMTREDSLASLVAIVITTFVALSAWAAWLLARSNKTSKYVQRGWLIIAGFFTYLAIDDGAMIHERLGTTLADATKDGWLANFPSYYWQLIFLPILTAFGVFLLYFLMRQLRSRQQKQAVLVALALLGAAIILDFFEGLSPSHSLNIYTTIANNFDFSAYTMQHFNQTEYATLLNFSKALEEALEIVAMSLLWITILAHLLANYPKINLRFINKSQN